MKNEESRRAIGRRLHEARKSAQLSQQEVAATLDVTRQTISGWEKGAAMPDIQKWMQIGIVYGASLDYLVFGIRTVPASCYGVIEKVFGRPGIQPSGAVFGAPELTEG